MFQDSLPLKAFDIYQPKPDETVTLEVEARRSKVSDNPHLAPKHRNCWRYVRKGGKEDNHNLLDTFIGPVLAVRRDVPLHVRFVNEIGAMPPMGDSVYATLDMPPINPIPMELQLPDWRKMNPSVGVVAHLHGGKIAHGADGWPREPISFLGNHYNFATSVTYCYPNAQRAALLWFHDHGMDNTSPQVHAGLAGLYLLKDGSDDELAGLYAGGLEVPLVIQDRNVDWETVRFDYYAGVPTSNATDKGGSLDGADPKDQKFDRPEFLGDTIFVNCRAWPFLDVLPRVYRLRIVNGSNARTYALALVDTAPWLAQHDNDYQHPPKVWFGDLLTVIGNDGGLFPKSIRLGATDHITIAPGERLDLLLDLTAVDPAKTPRLRLVNLAVNSLKNGDWPEGIFQTPAPVRASNIKRCDSAPAADPSNYPSVAGSLWDIAPADEFDRSPFAFLSIRQANIMQLRLSAAVAGAGLDLAKLDAILAKYASGDGFVWDGAKLDAPAGAPVARNRLVLLMNNTEGKSGDSAVTLSPWRDTQIWEMAPASSAPKATPFNLPFDVDLSASPAGPGAPGPDKPYVVTRATFFEKDFGPEARIDMTGVYAPMHAPSAPAPKAGTYERWYVANVGNTQPALANVSVDPKGGYVIPDMHPFHMHLVNFVVARRWALQLPPPGGDDKCVFVPVTDRPLDFDGVVRHDTVRINSNELLELLVYFPEGYAGEYPYHCHIVEHEDMGMMLSFTVEAASTQVATDKEAAKG